MEATPATENLPKGHAPIWLLGALPLALIIGEIAAFAIFGAPGLTDRNGVPVEDVAVERTVLHPGEFELTVRNDGPDPVKIAQVSINDGFVDFSGASDEIGRLSAATLTIPYDWITGEAYEISLLTSTGGTIVHPVDAAAETPQTDTGFFGLMALLGIYVGVIPIALGMLWLPFVRRIDSRWLQGFMALTVGLLAFLAIEATLSGIDSAALGSQAFGGSSLVFLGALAAFLALSGIDGYMRGRTSAAKEGGADGNRLALLIAIGIGMHNLGEGLAIGSSYAVGELALGTFLIVGFAIHNTTEGFAIVAPMADDPPGLGRLSLLGVIAGAPAIVGALIGAAAFNASLAAFLLGAGAGAIAQVITNLIPAFRDKKGRALHPVSVMGLLAGLLLMYATGLLVSI